RVAWADLKFSAPESGKRGWGTEAGQIWIRYGMPTQRLQTGFGSGARTLTWVYGDGISFTLSRLLGYRNARLAESSMLLLQDLDRAMPEMYRPRTVTRLVGLPVQVVRFRGEERGATRLELIA